jgi:hypothetical protein
MINSGWTKKDEKMIILILFISKNAQNRYKKYIKIVILLSIKLSVKVINDSYNV